jgi:hypothetical protein
MTYNLNENLGGALLLSFIVANVGEWVVYKNYWGYLFKLSFIINDKGG